jgi:hypothetical protein
MGVFGTKTTAKNRSFQRYIIIRVNHTNFGAKNQQFNSKKLSMTHLGISTSLELHINYLTNTGVLGTKMTAKSRLIQHHAIVLVIYTHFCDKSEKTSSLIP